MNSNDKVRLRGSEGESMEVTRLHAEMVQRARNLLGSGYILAYYSDVASEFTEVAEDHLNRAASEIAELKQRVAALEAGRSTRGEVMTTEGEQQCDSR